MAKTYTVYDVIRHYADGSTRFTVTYSTLARAQRLEGQRQVNGQPVTFAVSARETDREEYDRRVDSEREEKKLHSFASEVLAVINSRKP